MLLNVEVSKGTGCLLLLLPSLGLSGLPLLGRDVAVDEARAHAVVSLAGIVIAL